MIFIIVLKKDKKINIIFSKNTFQFIPDGIINRLKNFYDGLKISNDIIDHLNMESVTPGMAFIEISNWDLINFIKAAQEKSFKLCKDIRIIFL